MSTDTEVLTPQHVETVFMACLFRDDEDTSDHIVVEGVLQAVGFHPGRVEEHRQEIHDMLAELLDDFKISHGVATATSTPAWTSTATSGPVCTGPRSRPSSSASPLVKSSTAFRVRCGRFCQVACRTSWSSSSI